MAGLVPVKVALLSDCYAPRLGGIEVQTHDLAQQLSAAGHDVEVFTATGRPGVSRSSVPTLEDGLTVHRFDLGLPGGIPINPFATREVGRRLRAGEFDVAHVQMGVVSPFAVDMARVALRAGVPTAVTWHCVIDGSAPLHRLLGYADRWAQRGAALSAVSGMAADRVRRLLSPQRRVAVLPNGIDVSRWRPRADRPEVPVEPVRIVLAQRLARRKRPEAALDVLLRARELTPARVPLRADLIGDGPMRGPLQRRIDAVGADWIRLPGRLTRRDLRERHWRSHIFVSASRLEAFGIAALEARTAGLAVVARTGTGHQDFVFHGQTGLLADSDEGLAAAVAQLASEPALLRRIQRHNLRVAPPQDWGHVVTTALAEYRRAHDQAVSR